MTKLGYGRNTSSPADGRNAGHGLRRRTTRGRVRPIFSAPSARPKEKAPGSYYPPATVKPWRFIWRKSRLRSRPACLEEAFHPRQHHALAVAAEIARAQSGREHLAIHARQLALEPRLQILR